MHLKFHKAQVQQHAASSSAVGLKQEEPEDDDGISALSYSQFGALDKSVGNVSAISGMFTKRSPYIIRFKNMENEDSLSMTPISNLNKSELTSKGAVVSKKFQNQEGASDGGAENLKSSTADLKSNNLKHQ